MSRVQAATIPWAGHLVLLWAKDSMALIAELHLILNTKKTQACKNSTNHGLLQKNPNNPETPM